MTRWSTLSSPPGSRSPLATKRLPRRRSPRGSSRDAARPGVGDRTLDRALALQDAAKDRRVLGQPLCMACVHWWWTDALEQARDVLVEMLQRSQELGDESIVSVRARPASARSSACWATSRAPSREHWKVRRLGAVGPAHELRLQRRARESRPRVSRPSRGGQSGGSQRARASACDRRPPRGARRVCRARPPRARARRAGRGRRPPRAGDGLRPAGGHRRSPVRRGS